MWGNLRTLVREQGKQDSARRENEPQCNCHRGVSLSHSPSYSRVFESQNGPSDLTGIEKRCRPLQPSHHTPPHSLFPLSSSTHRKYVGPRMGCNREQPKELPRGGISCEPSAANTSGPWGNKKLCAEGRSGECTTASSTGTAKRDCGVQRWSPFLHPK